MTSTPEQNRAAVKKHYYKNKEYYYEKNKRARERKLLFLRELKEYLGCKDCGKNFPHYQLEYDHIEKYEFRLASVSKTWKQILKELDKCEVVCCNCHATRTWTRKNKL